jgi:UDPglucose 6-dehydrogenase
MDKGLKLYEKRYEALEKADGLIIMTEWNAFREPDFYLIKESMKTAVIFDGRNLYDPHRMEKLGIVYYSIGRPKVN